MIIWEFQFLVLVYVLGSKDYFCGISDAFNSNLSWSLIWFTNFLSENFPLLAMKIIL